MITMKFMHEQALMTIVRNANMCPPVGTYIRNTTFLTHGLPELLEVSAVTWDMSSETGTEVTVQLKRPCTR